MALERGMFDLTGKAALVTGASGGIGGAIARALHAQGATVTLSGTRAEMLEGLKAGLGARAHAVVAKMDDAADIERLAKDAEAAMGKIDILVNNAGITRDNISMRMKDEEWDRVLQINLTGAFRLARAVMRGMMRRRHGRIVSITSVVGTTGNPGQANYAAAKAGLAGMTKSLAQELASRNITVNCLAPGFIATPMTDVLSDDQKKAILARVPADRLGTPQEIAAGVVYLASDEAAYVTGQTLHINGGMAMV
jgi:3-oxoacyl-[acyl-carrier protein] reductase